MKISNTKLWQQLRRNWAIVILAIVSFSYVSAAVIMHDKPISPIDEWLYIDYAYKAPNQLFVHQGEIVGPEVRTLMSCDGFVLYGKFGEACSDQPSNNLDNLPNSGVSTASAYTPIFFLITRILGDPIHWFTGLDLLTSWRVTGGFWLAGGLVLFGLLSRRWGIPEFVTLSLGLVFIGSPFVFWTFTYLSTDAPSFLIGALLLLLATRFASKEISGWWLVGASVLASLLKVTNLLGVGLVSLYLFLNWLQKRRLSDPNVVDSNRLVSIRNLTITVFSAIGGAVMAQLAWMRIVSLSAVSNLSVDQGISSELTGRELMTQALSFLPSAIRHNPFPIEILDLFYSPLSWLMIAGVFGSFFAYRWIDRRAPIVWSIAAASIVAAPALALMISAVSESYFQLPARYGAVLIPAFLIATGLIMRNRVANTLIAIYGAMLIVASLFLANVIQSLYG